MSTRGMLKYECQECHKGQLIYPQRPHRAARLRCAYCGSARMEAKSRNAHGDEARKAAARDLSTSGSVVRQDRIQRGRRPH